MERRAALSRNYIRDAYLNSPLPAGEPILQIIGFEVSLQEDSTIIIRLSDQTVFIDCFLIGPYVLDYSRALISTMDSTTEFHLNDLIRLKDFFSKIDNKRICKLRIIIRKIELAQKLNQRLGCPAEVSQYYQNNTGPSDAEAPTPENQVSEARLSQPQEQIQRKIEDQPQRRPEQQIQRRPEDQAQRRPQQNNTNPPNEHSSMIKLEDDPENHQTENRVPEPSVEGVAEAANNGNSNMREERDTPLTLREIIQGKEGYFVGRLLRVKMTTKETKDGSISVLFLGLVDRSGDLVRVNMAGRMAIKEAKELKKHKCYFIKGLQTFQTEKMQFPQIRLKDKDFKVMEVQQPNMTEQYARSYYRWDHEHEQLQDNESIDVIGVVDQIEEKASYPHVNSSESREVVRIVVRNTFKTVKVSFWAEQIKALRSIKLRRKQPIVLEDIKKKKNMFLDFTYESSVVKLEDDAELKEELKSLLPQPEQKEDPKNIRQLDELYEEEPTSNKVRTLRVYLSRLQQNRIIYKLCQNCKRKVEKFSQTCPQCDKNEFYYKFNCQLEFADHTGSFSCVAFEFSAHKIFNKTASEINLLSREHLSDLIDACLFDEYEVGIENKNLRLIVRNIENVTARNEEKITHYNLSLIRSCLAKQN